MQFLFKKKYWFVFFLVAQLSTKAQTIFPYHTISAPTVLHEFSGIGFIKPNRLFGINDSGNEPQLFEMDTLGKILNVFKDDKFKNIDWEELIAYKNKIFIMDIGDNRSIRSKLTIYSYDIDRKEINDFNFSIAEKNPPMKPKDKIYDAEASFILNDSIYLFTKSHSKPFRGITKQYVFSFNHSSQKISSIDSLNIGNNGFISDAVTGAAVSQNGKIAAILTCQKLILFVGWKGNHVLEGYYQEFSFEGLTQKEAVTFIDNDKVVIADERTAGLIGGRIYFYNVSKFVNGNSNYIKDGVSCSIKHNSKKKEFQFHFSSKKKRSEIKVVFISDSLKIKNEIILAKQTSRFSGKFDENLLKDFNRYWIACENEILYSGKLKN